MAMQRNLPQSKEALLKSYRTRLKDDVKSMLENFEGNICRLNSCEAVKKCFFYRNRQVSEG